jgi:hydroxymethylpyrimidine pyrophosphatase-like HAD family hydrolase
VRYLALATDYDGTLAADGRVSGATIAALERLKDSGRRLILVTGRELDDLLGVFPEVAIFDQVVAENGALLYEPSSREEKVLGEAPSSAFLDALNARGVPMSTGRVIVGTREPHESEVLEAIKELGLELQVIFNKGAVMVLPHGINKATGLRAALEQMGLSAHNVVGAGDAENDHSFLRLCEIAVAVANALPAVKEAADLVTKGERGEGVTELVDRMIESDLAELAPQLGNRKIVLGTRQDGSVVGLDPFETNLLISGSSGAGKSSIVVGLLERFAEAGYQFCLVDPEGDYLAMPGAVRLGDEDHKPSFEEISQVLANPDQSVVVNLLGVRLKDRPAVFQGVLTRLLELRASTGRPHWLVVDEAHHLMPEQRETTQTVLPQEFGGLLLITVHADLLSRAAASLVDGALAVGKSPKDTLEGFARAAGFEAPKDGRADLEPGSALVWFPSEGPPFLVRTEPPKVEHNRHHRKYAEGTLGEDRSFYFRGPEEKLNLKAVNLVRFVELAEGVDDETWAHHLRAGDYSRWFRESIKDDELAQEVKDIEADESLDADESRRRVAEAVEARYTLPGDEESGTRTD